MFESFVNSERYKTTVINSMSHPRLRALLIQKDTKQSFAFTLRDAGLRALLIQKDTKRSAGSYSRYCRLRALLIQKDTKQL